MKTHPGRSTYIAQLLLSIALLLFLGLASACQRPGGQDLQSISLPMGYVANVQFSPFYVAKERGYFAQEGFDVTFDYRWETDGIQLTASGEVPFTVASGDQIIQARSHGLPVIAIAGWYQRFPVAIIIYRPESPPGGRRLDRRRHRASNNRLYATGCPD